MYKLPLDTFPCFAVCWTLGLVGQRILVENITQQLDDYYHAIVILPIHHWYQYPVSSITIAVPVPCQYPTVCLTTTSVPESCKTLPYIRILVSSKLFRIPAYKYIPTLQPSRHTNQRCQKGGGCMKEGGGYTSDTNNYLFDTRKIDTRKPLLTFPISVSLLSSPLPPVRGCR